VLVCEPHPLPDLIADGGRLAFPNYGTLSPEWRVLELHGDSCAERSERVRHALEALHREHRFERIEFRARGGLGFRAIQAKAASLAFQDMTLAVRLDGISRRDREREQRWPRDFEEVLTDFAERFAFENADTRIEPNADLASFARKCGWEPLASAPAATGEPLVSIAIAHYNLGAFLPQTLESLAAQTYVNFEVIVIDDGSTDAASRAVFDALEAKYPQWRFLRQTNAGIGATRNRCLELARGEFFVPVDADNLARPEMVRTFVRAIRRNPHLAAMSCYFLAFETREPTTFTYALRPTGGPHALAGIRNVYGDANAIFRTDALRAIGGYESDRGTSCEDWEAFVKLVHAGFKLGVVPNHLFYYRHRPGGFSRSTNWYANHQRVLRQFAHSGSLPPAELLEVWSALLGFHQGASELSLPKARRHRVADALHALVTKPLNWLRGRNA
jgi:GT2 family glycosyltransferase